LVSSQELTNVGHLASYTASDLHRRLGKWDKFGKVAPSGMRAPQVQILGLQVWRYR
jgi:hypothetical protein